jgi:hypothetical protein
MVNQLLVCIINDFLNITKNIKPIYFNIYKAFALNNTILILMTKNKKELPSSNKIDKIVSGISDSIVI